MQIYTFFYVPGYKNRRRNIITSSETAEVAKSFLADSSVSVTMSAVVGRGYQRIRDSVIIGESANIGEEGAMGLTYFHHGTRQKKLLTMKNKSGGKDGKIDFIEKAIYQA